MVQKPENAPELGFCHHYKHDPAKGVRDYAYEIVGIGCHTEDNCRPEDAYLVIYRPLYPSSVYTAGKMFDVRPLDMFVETVTKDGVTKPRFAPVTDPAVIAELEAARREMYPDGQR